MILRGLFEIAAVLLLWASWLFAAMITVVAGLMLIAVTVDFVTGGTWP